MTLEAGELLGAEVRVRLRIFESLSQALGNVQHGELPIKPPSSASRKRRLEQIDDYRALAMHTLDTNAPTSPVKRWMVQELGHHYHQMVARQLTFALEVNTKAYTEMLIRSLQAEREGIENRDSSSPVLDSLERELEPLEADDYAGYLSERRTLVRAEAVSLVSQIEGRMEEWSDRLLLAAQDFPRTHPRPHPDADWPATEMATDVVNRIDCLRIAAEFDDPVRALPTGIRHRTWAAAFYREMRERLIVVAEHFDEPGLAQEVLSPPERGVAQ